MRKLTLEEVKDLSAHTMAQYMAHDPVKYAKLMHSVLQALIVEIERVNSDRKGG